MAQLRKPDLIKILVEEYGYEIEDLKFDAEGKPYTNAKLQALIKAEEDDAKELESDSTRVVAPKSKVKREDKILVMNGITGALVYHSERSNKTWTFEDFGNQDTIEYEELLIMRNKHPRYFTEGLLIVLDKDVQKEFNLTEMYKNIITPDNADKIFKMDNLEELEKFIDNLPDGMKTSFVNMAMKKYEADELDSVKLVKFIQNKFNFNFETNAPLDDIVGTREKKHNMIIVEKKR